MCVNSLRDRLTERKSRDILYAVEIALSRVVEGTGPMKPGNRSFSDSGAKSRSSADCWKMRRMMNVSMRSRLRETVFSFVY